MNRFTAFLLGTVVGAGLVYGSLKYHVVRATDGFHMVPKITSGFAKTYVDVRGFGLAEWSKHPSLAAALVKADKEHVLGKAADESIRNAAYGVLEALKDDGS